MVESPRAPAPTSLLRMAAIAYGVLTVISFAWSGWAGRPWAYLDASAAARGIALRALHAAAEQLPLEPACLDLVVVADALHFLDTELTARQIARVLAPRGALALVTCQFADTPFMRGVLDRSRVPENGCDAIQQARC